MMNQKKWVAGVAPVAVVMISLNEAHNMEAVCQNLAGWAKEVFLVDSFSQDDTVEIAAKHGVHVVERAFNGFGDQWQFAMDNLPITAEWTMKLDPDERLSDALKANIITMIESNTCQGITYNRRRWLMGRPLKISDKILRVWQTGTCQFSDVSVNEHPVVSGKIKHVKGVLEHLDSPNLEHWVKKQNHYSSLDAINRFLSANLAEQPRLFGSGLQRRMWLKKNFFKLPFRYVFLFAYFWLFRGLWRSGRAGYLSARLWVNFYFIQECKLKEMEWAGEVYLSYSEKQVRESA